MQAQTVSQFLQAQLVLLRVHNVPVLGGMNLKTVWSLAYLGGSSKVLKFIRWPYPLQNCPHRH